MVAAGDLRPDVRAFDAGHQPLGDNEVVDAPSGVVLPGVEAVAPPRVGAGAVGVQGAERVHKAALQQLGHLAPFLIGEAGIHSVGLGILQVDLLMGHVQVAAVDHRLFGVQRHQIGTDVVLPFHAVVQPGQLILGVGGVAADQIEIVELGGDDPSLVAVDIVSEVIGHGQGRTAREHGGAGVARLVGAVPEPLVALQRKGCLLRTHLRLLQADDVRIRQRAEVQKALVQAGPQAVDVP